MLFIMLTMLDYMTILSAKTYGRSMLYRVYKYTLYSFNTKLSLYKFYNSSIIIISMREDNSADLSQVIYSSLL